MNEYMNEYMKETNEALLHTYNQFPVVLDHGEGVYLYDTEGKKYLDFAAGYAVSSLGYGNQELNEALKAQIDKLFHTSNLYYNTVCGKAAEDLKRITGMDRIFFTNSGGEAVEGTLKAARKYAYKKGTGRYEFIAMKESFHGRSFGALSVTGHDPYRAPFEPLVPGVSFAEYNDLDSVKALVTDKTCAIILEPLQGEGGINLATEEFMKGIRKLCDEEGILMICDEVQCGMGRTGSMFTWQSYGIRPDIMSMAKAIGNGIPVGAFAMTEEIAKYSLEPGDHGTTYGGNPLACTAVSKTIEIFEKKNLVAHVQELGAYLTEKLEELRSECDCVKAVKGKGLMQGIQVTKPLSEITKEALKEGLLIIGAGNDVIRFVPPLIIEKEHVDEMTTGLWVSNIWVQLSAFLACLAVWFLAGRADVTALAKVEPKYMLLGGVIGAGITWTVVKSMASLGPAKAALLIVISQLIVAYVIELLGMFGVEKSPFAFRKLDQDRKSTRLNSSH